MRRTDPSLFRPFHPASPRVLLALSGLLGSLIVASASHAAGAHHGMSGMHGTQASPSSSSTSSSTATSGAAARPEEPLLDNSGNYRQEVRACREGRTAEDLPTCLREARNAEADRKRGRLTNQGDFQQNALARCQAFNGPQDKEACRARILGHVEIQGSVAGGGILRQVAITVPAPQNPQQPDSSAMGAGRPPSTLPPSDDIGTDNEALPEDQDMDPGLDEGETLEEQSPAPEPSR